VHRIVVLIDTQRQQTGQINTLGQGGPQNNNTTIPKLLAIAHTHSLDLCVEIDRVSTAFAADAALLLPTKRHSATVLDKHTDTTTTTKKIQQKT